MNANHTDNYDESQRELAAGALKQAEQDLRRFHGAVGTIERELYLDAYFLANNSTRPGVHALRFPLGKIFSEMSRLKLGRQFWQQIYSKNSHKT